MARSDNPVAMKAGGVRRALPDWNLLPQFRLWSSNSKARIDYICSLALIFIGSFGLSFVISSSLEPHPTIVSSNAVTVASAEDPTALPRSAPVHIDIPDISVSAAIVEQTTDEKGALDAPDDYTQAGWYVRSPTPGEIGPSIITGHVDNYLGPAVFFYLKDLQPHERIVITRDDGSTATFTVDSVKVFDQENFPTNDVYGNIDHAGLRLITCGGTYSPLSGRYSQNIVVYASLTKSP